MSKFLKFIVNLFLICAILVAAAIIVPPFVGVGTTIVDSQLMDTNLPMGSVTYSADTYVTELKEGDQILDENDVSTYVYTVKAIDTAKGTVTVQDTYDSSVQEKQIQVLNSESKVILTIPYIGYVVYAMHSIEGIIILALAVLLIIILFILSELWRRDDDDDEDDEDDYDDEDDDETAVRITEPDSLGLENEVDITPYIHQEGEPAVKEPADEEPAPKAAEAEIILPQEEAPAEASEESVPAAEIKEPAAAEIPEEAEEENAAVPEEVISGETEPVISEGEEEMAEAAETEAAAEIPEETVPEEPVNAEEPDVTPEEAAGIDMAFLERELEAALDTGAVTEETPAPVQETPAQPEETAAEIPYEEQPEPETLSEPESPAEVPEDLAAAAEKIVEETPEPDIYDERRYLEEAGEEENDPEADTFIPITRPTLEMIMKGAERSGEEPVVLKEPVTGLTYVDYSDIL